MSNTEEKAIKFASKHWIDIMNKWKKSLSIFLLSNFILFSITTMLIVFNIYAIRLNKSATSKIFFLAVAVISSVASLLSASLSLFHFKHSYRVSKGYQNQIMEEVEKFKRKDEPYNEKNANSLLVERVLKIRGYIHEDDE